MSLAGGFTDVTLLGGYVLGKVPFPLLNISPANQSLAYKRDAYIEMNYLELVSDHYAGLNLTHTFNGFLLNKVPLLKHLKWREFLSAKILYGGLRAENDPAQTKGLYRLPADVYAWAVPPTSKPARVSAISLSFSASISSGVSTTSTTLAPPLMASSLASSRNFNGRRRQRSAYYSIARLQNTS